MKNNIKLPNFLCVGTSKTGTTSMYFILKQHPEIYLNDKIKESFFFCRNYKKGISHYKKLFEDVKNEKAIGEIAPSYLFEANPEHLQKHLGNNIKLIFIFRNPATRAFSHYKMMTRKLREKRTFNEIVKTEIQGGITNILYTNYVHKGFYDILLQKYLNVFDKKNMLFLIYETDINKNIEQTYYKIQKFLNVNPIKLDTNIRMMPGVKITNKNFDKLLNTANPINQFAKKIIPSRKARALIKQFLTKNSHVNTNIRKNKLKKLKPYLINDIYKQSILNLEKMIDKNLSIWYK